MATFKIVNSNKMRKLPKNSVQLSQKKKMLW